MELLAESAENCGLKIINGPKTPHDIWLTAPLDLNLVPVVLQLAALSALFSVLVKSPGLLFALMPLVGSPW